MGTIVVCVEVFMHGFWVRLFDNVELEVEEACNREMNHAFTTQHPELFSKIPHWTDERGFTFRCPFECIPHVWMEG